MSKDESLFANSESTEREELERLVDPEPAPKKRRVGRPRKNASMGKTPANPRPQVPKTVSTRSSSSSKQSDQQGLVTPATTVPVSGSTESSAISSEQMSLLLTAINSSKKAVDRQIAEFRREIQKSNKEVSQKLSKKLKTGRSLDFKRKGNEKQYIIFNEEVDDKLDTAESGLAKISLESLPKEAKSPYKRAKDALTEDIQCSSIWEEILGFKDPALSRLARALPETMFQARASSTTTKYTRAYQRWKDWVEKEHGGKSFPVSIALFALYLQHLGESTKSHFAVTEAVNAVAWVQRMAGVETVAQNHLIKSISEGFQKSLACPGRKKSQSLLLCSGSWWHHWEFPHHSRR